MYYLNMEVTVNKFSFRNTAIWKIKVDHLFSSSNNNYLALV